MHVLSRLGQLPFRMRLGKEVQHADILFIGQEITGSMTAVMADIEGFISFRRTAFRSGFLLVHGIDTPGLIRLCQNNFPGALGSCREEP